MAGLKTLMDEKEVPLPNSVPLNKLLMVNLLVWSGSSRYNGLCPLFSVLGLPLNLWNGGNFIAKLYMGPVWTGHSLFRHFNTSMCCCEII